MRRNLSHFQREYKLLYFHLQHNKEEFFLQSYQEKGYATEAALGLVESLFANNKARRIVAFCDPLNTASWKLLERLNMRREGHLIKNVSFFKDENDEPIWKDSYEYAILKEEWQRTK